MFLQSDCWDLENNKFWSPAKRVWRAKRNSNRWELRWAAQSCTKPNYNREEVRWTPRRPAKWKLQVINTSLARKTRFSLSSSPKNVPQTLKPYFPPPKTTGGRRELPLLAVGPPHQEEHFNQSGILRILLEDSMEKIPQFPSFSEVILTSKPCPS